MELEFRRETVRCWQAVCRTTLEQEETAECIVPDACPDIWQVLDSRGRMLLQRKEPQEGRGEFSGLIRVNILYQPEGEGALESMEVTLPFAASPDLSQVTRRCVLRAEPRLLWVDVHLLNPRKILVRANWELKVEGWAPSALSLACYGEEGETYALRQKPGQFRSLVVTGVQEKAFSYTDGLTLPAGCPEPQTILSVRADCTCTEARVIGTKLVFKGEARLKLLLRGEEGTLFPAEFRLPYSQLMDAGEDSEDAVCDMTLYFSDVKCTLDPDDPRMLQAELSVQAQACMEKEVQVPILSDLYSTAWEVQTQREEVPLRSMAGASEDQIALRQVLETSETLGEILDVQARPGRCDQRREGEDWILGQEVRWVVLVRGEEGMVSLEGITRVEHRLPGLGEKEISCRWELLREPAASPIPGGVEVSGLLSVRWTAMETGATPVITRVTLGEQREKSGESPSVIIRAVRTGETLWDVAKDCLSTEGEIMEATGLTSGEVWPGEMLLIPKG
ncbi:MAG: DUF3794 domain-containing protein [Ruminiclostridium sp.]|nr:DUF3794 domain-containing protein [Ruminiclostridium sp.]